jgi:hypothetical protein
MEALYRCLLHCYPASYFREYAEEMTAVFLQAHNAARKQGLTCLVVFDAREVLGVLRGALREWLSHHDCGLWRSFDMRTEFRFPRSTILLMLLVLVGLTFAIENARRVSAGDASGMPVWGLFLRLFALGVGAMAIAGAIGYGVLVVLRRTGVDRIANTQTWPHRR